MLKWGIIGAGSIAKVFANGLRFAKSGELEAIASRTPGKADTLADIFDVAKRYDSYEALLADEAIDAVYVSTIHPAHLEPVVMAAEAGKHILVEKPIAMNAAEARTMVFLMEAFMYRCHPQIAKMVELIQSGAIGDVLLIRSEFGFHAPFNATSRTYSNELGGGGIMDVGCYPASMVRLIAGEPNRTQGHWRRRPNWRRSLHRGHAQIRERHHRRNLDCGGLQHSQYHRDSRIRRAADRAQSVAAF